MARQDSVKEQSTNWSVNNPTGTNGLIGIDKLGDAIRFFDPITLAEIKVIPHKNNHEVAISPDHTRAYVSEFGKFAAGDFVESGAHIAVVDLVKKEIIHRVNTGSYTGPHAMVHDPSGRLWVIFEETGELGCMDVDCLELTDIYDIGAAGLRPPFIEILPDGSKIYISCKKGNLIVFDVTKRKVHTNIIVPVGTEGMAISPCGRRLYVAENSKQNLLEIDTSTDQIISEIALKGAVLSNPRTSRLIRMRFSPDGAWLVSTNYASGVMHIHDANNPADHVMLPIAKGPQGIAFPPDGKQVLVSNHDCGLITRVDLETAKAIECVAAGKGIEALTYY